MGVNLGDKIYFPDDNQFLPYIWLIMGDQFVRRTIALITMHI
jgi:hypothetical protein